MKKERLKYYLRGTGILLLCLAVVFISLLGIALNGSETQKNITLICFGCFSGVVLIGYWIYAFIYEKRKKEKRNSNFDFGKEKEKDE